MIFTKCPIFKAFHNIMPSRKSLKNEFRNGTVLQSLRRGEKITSGASVDEQVLIGSCPWRGAS